MNSSYLVVIHPFNSETLVGPLCIAEMKILRAHLSFLDDWHLHKFLGLKCDAFNQMSIQ